MGQKETLLEPQTSYVVLIMQKSDTEKPAEAADKPTSNAEAAPAEASRGVGETGSKAIPEHVPEKGAAEREGVGPSAVPPQVSLLCMSLHIFVSKGLLTLEAV